MSAARPTIQGPPCPAHAGGWLYAGTQWIRFHRKFQVSGSVLIEDNGWINYGDEIIHGDF